MPSLTGQKADDEREIRNLVAGWLRLKWGNSLSVAQEPELANGQRMDISLQNPNVPLPVPIELKLLDKHWTGPGLCEYLANQLVRDYLREADGRCGLMLLVWHETKPGRRWQIDGKLVGVSGIRDALRCHWAGIANDFPYISAIEILVIDLTARAIV